MDVDKHVCHVFKQRVDLFAASQSEQRKFCAEQGQDSSELRKPHRTTAHQRKARESYLQDKQQPFPVTPKEHATLFFPLHSRHRVAAPVIRASLLIRDPRAKIPRTGFRPRGPPTAMITDAELGYYAVYGGFGVMSLILVYHYTTVPSSPLEM